MTRPDTATKLATDVSTMFDEVSPRYDLINDVLSAGNSRLWRIAMTRALQPRKGMRILDLAAGTGTASAAIAAHGAHVTAADFSEGMLEVGRGRHTGDGRIDFVFADATALPFEDDSFDAATISFGLRNVNEPKRALAEMRRVVKPGGRIVICEFSQPVSAIRGPYSLYSRHVLPRIAGALNRSAEEAYRYLNESIEQWPDQQELAAWMREAGLERVAYRNLTLGIVALHRGFVPRPAEATVDQAAVTAEKAPAVAKPSRKKPAAKKAAPAKKPAASARASGAEASGAETAPAKDPAARTAPAAKKSTAQEPAKRKPTATSPSTAARKTAAKPAAKKAAPAAKPGTAAKPAGAKAPTAAKAGSSAGASKKAPTAKKPASAKPAAKKASDGTA